jgi:hypothetical protein
MQPCVNGKGDFEGLDWKERDRLQRRFIGLIRSGNLLGVSAALDLRAYDAHKLRFKKVRAHPRANLLPAYYLMVQTLLQAVVHAVNDTDLPAGEKVEFVFDVKKGFSGNALDIFKELSQDPTFGARLKGASFQDSKDYPGLQAADILAYEAREHAAGAWAHDPVLPVRWQWWELKKSVVKDTYIPADEVLGLVSEMERRLLGNVQDA